ncbi:origin recognition complex subunit 5 C-terminus-domain-containing protein [Desarmillaria tabescens]|uniref:Origin recognition complex subunit 5 C-terminus-domain-containing protein n=1 Tax=Armillaria tabescens TaxID=1929756 RepID=A0AA39K4E2_ARMTA|nr:origin recognition complex subunit 5 C-terminus-domain-containing protein [Desarmillaria tabescens]KAK0452979.1 origin recognition complex subunit 5 C-terminus-domain-containing protein [Desarmillaria tabescens]
MASNPLSYHHHRLREASFLLQASPPPFIFINDPISPRSTAQALLGALSLPTSTTTSMHHVHVNAVTCFSARLLFDAILNGLARWMPSWEEGCTNWSGPNDTGHYNESLDAFLRGLKTLYSFLHHSNSNLSQVTRFVIVVERAERLKDRLPDLVVPLTRLAEMARIDLAIIFISSRRWDDMRPSFGASPDPYFVDIAIPTKEACVAYLCSMFQSCQTQPNLPLNPYHPALEGMYTSFASILCDTCFPFTNDPDELAYAAAARWPGFIQPILDNHAIEQGKGNSNLTERDDNEHLFTDDAMLVDDVHGFVTPSEEVRMRLNRYFKPSITAALEQLYPRSSNAQDWAGANKPSPEALGTIFPIHRADHPTEPRVDAAVKEKLAEPYRNLTRMAKFILISSFLASMNPAKSDLRMFGRGLDEKKRKRRRITKAPSAKTKSGPIKIPQHFLGPAAFTLDRMLAILGALLEENDNDDDFRPFKIDFSIPGEYTDMEVSRVGVCATIVDLTSSKLLHRTSPAEKLDGPPMFKSGVSYDVVLGLAKELDVPLQDLLWDPL